MKHAIHCAFLFVNACFLYEVIKNYAVTTWADGAIYEMAGARFSDYCIYLTFGLLVWLAFTFILKNTERTISDDE